MDLHSSDSEVRICQMWKKIKEKMRSIKLIESPETKDIEFNSRISRISGEQLRDILQGNHEEMVVL